MSDLPETIKLALASGGRRITTSTRAQIQKEFKEASDRQRQATVVAFHTYGVPDEYIAQILGVNPSDIRERRDQALKNVSQEVNALPEGPMLMAQIVIEGYSNLAVSIAAVSQRAMESILTRIDEGEADSKDHSALQGYMKIMIESRNALTNRMERYGMLPLVPKTYVSGGIGIASEDEAPFENHMKSIAEKSGVNFEDLKRQIIEESVQ